MSFTCELWLCSPCGTQLQWHTLKNLTSLCFTLLTYPNSEMDSLLVTAATTIREAGGTVPSHAEQGPNNKRKRVADSGQKAVKSTIKSRKRGGTYYRECVTCCTSKAVSQYPKLIHDAKHASDVCFRCWEQHLECEVGSKEAGSQQCPRCEKTALEPEIRKLAKSVTYHK